MKPSGPSQDQDHLARLLGINVAADTFAVAAARLLDSVATALGYDPTKSPSGCQISFAFSLGLDVTSDTKRVASAKIGGALFAKNQEAIAALNLEPGDHVVRVTQFEHNGALRSVELDFVVSSIQPNGRVFFKGGNDQGAWPVQLRKPVG